MRTVQLTRLPARSFTSSARTFYTSVLSRGMSLFVCPFGLIAHCASSMLTLRSHTVDVINLMCQVDRITETGPYAEDTKHGETSASRAATPRASVHDTTRVGQTSERKERLCVLLDGRPSKGPTALGRAHSMPVISRARSTSISHSSPSGKRGAPSKPHSRGQGLQAVKE